MTVSSDLIKMHNTESNIIASLHKSGAETYSFLITMKLSSLCFKNDSINSHYKKSQ